MEQCLRTSLEQYRVIIDHARQLDSMLHDVDPIALQTHVERLQQLQEEASVNDERVFELYADNNDYWQQHPLLIERNDLIEQIIELNHSLLPKIRSIMAVVASELMQIKDGRQAVTGYNRPLHGGRQAAREVG